MRTRHIRQILWITPGLILAPLAAHAQSNLGLTGSREYPPPTQPRTSADSAEVKSLVAADAKLHLVMDGVRFVLHTRSAQMGGRDRTAEESRSLATLFNLPVATGAEIMRRLPNSSKFDTLPAGLRSVVVSDPIFFGDSARLSVDHTYTVTQRFGPEPRPRVFGGLESWSYRLVRENGRWRIAGIGRFWGS